MTPHPARELNQRPHRRGLDHGPVIVVIPSDLGHGRAQHDEQLIPGLHRIDAPPHVGQIEHRGLPTPIQGGIQQMFDPGPQEQRKL